MKLIAYTSIFLIDQHDRILVIKRAPWKKFAPNKYTGVGGTATAEENHAIEQCLEREFDEETKIGFKDLHNVTLRGSIHVINRNEDDHIMFFYTATVNSDTLDLACTEGELEWVTKEQLNTLDWVHTIGRFYHYVFDPSVKRFAGIIDDKSFDTKVQIISSM